jgi:hypothetical protein
MNVYIKLNGVPWKDTQAWRATRCQTMKIGSILIAILALFAQSCSGTKSALALPKTGMKTSIEQKAAFQLPQSAKLIIGAGGIYAAFLYYGTLQEDVFHYKADDGSKFKAAWFLQFLGM